MSAFCFGPDGTMEERNGWQRAVLATRKYDVVVLYNDEKEQHQEILKRIASSPFAGSMTIHPVSCDDTTLQLINHEPTFYFGYRRWQKAVFRKASELHRQAKFSMAHTVTICGYREPGYLMNLDIPHVWGPIGGTHNFNMAYKTLLDKPNLVREWSRTIVNNLQLRFSRRVSNALRKSLVLSASKETQRHLWEFRRVRATVDLETGIDYPLPAPRVPRNPSAPIKLLWSGRLRAWKGLPLLLRALHELPSSVPFELRVVGTGICDEEWKALAESLGIADRISWWPWTHYRDTLSHYDWAEAFVFTSLRDTSGTGLVEAAAAGAPIIGVNHQGASDLVCSGAGIPISVGSPRETIDEIRMAIERLATSPDLWLQMSRQSQEVARKLAWANRVGDSEHFYVQAEEQYREARGENTSEGSRLADALRDEVSIYNFALTKWITAMFANADAANKSFAFWKNKR